MTPKERVAMQQALEALEMIATYSEEDKQCDNGYGAAWVANTAITTLREALAEQAEQEPVAWMWRCKPYCDWPNWSVSIKRPVDSGCGDFPKTKGYEDIPLYAAPVRTKDLTDEELHQIWRDIKSLVGLYSFQEIARAAIAADREKNK